MICERVQTFMITRVGYLDAALLFIQVILLHIATVGGLLLLLAFFELQVRLWELLLFFSGFTTPRCSCHLTFKFNHHVIKVSNFTARRLGLTAVSRRRHISLLGWLTALLNRLPLRILDIVEGRLPRLLKQLAKNRHCLLLVHVRHHF